MDEALLEQAPAGFPLVDEALLGLRRCSLGQRGTADAVALWHSLGASRSALRGGQVDEAVQAAADAPCTVTRHRPLWGLLSL